MNGSNMNSLKDDRIIREEFSNWLNTTSSKLPEYELKANPSRKYYFGDKLLSPYLFLYPFICRYYNIFFSFSQSKS